MTVASHDQAHVTQDRLEALNRMFGARSIAVLGASQDARRIGSRPIAYTQQTGFDGTIYPVNPRREEILGLRCHPSLASIEDPVDLCVMALPACEVLGAMEQCADAGVRSAVVFSAGFAEAGEPDLQERLARMAREAGITLLGPNCLGFLNFRSGLMASFTSLLEAGGLGAGRVGFACQSGALGAYFLSLARRREMAFDLWVSTGNEVDVTVSDCIGYMALDPKIEVIGALMEGSRDGSRLRWALELARSKGKPVVLLKFGRSAIGRRAIASHTANLAGDDAVFDAVVKTHGAYRADDFDEFLDVIQACSFGSFPRGRNVCFVSVSGGAGALMADIAGDVGLELPDVPADAQQRLLTRLPFATVHNPVDFTAQFVNDPSLLADFLGLVAASGRFDAIVSFLGHTVEAETLAERAMPAYMQVAHEHDAVFIMSGLTTPSFERELRARGLMLLPNPASAVRLLHALRRIAEALADGSAGTDVRPPAELVRRLNRFQGGAISGSASARVAESHALLDAMEVPRSRATIARDPDEAAAAASALGYPVALKVIAEGITHKAQAGGVELNIADAAGLAAAYARIVAKVGGNGHSAGIDGVLVEEMLPAGTEVLVGVRRDPAFGPIVVVGTGGVDTEAVRDIELAPAPLDVPGATRLIGRTRIGATLGPEREAVAAVVSRLSHAIALLPDVAEIELNPLLVSSASVKAADVLVVPVSEG